ncbi:right-handed parallel beta-helix repeat-containing protein [Prosthecobacter vanneervenii]|uniref:Nitrous oxidase accessory protein NosD n=1 Tax=Prosthecobacter vanneervenii TaxID=48466 RepID=A0A7W7YE53_9BACT|nr:right-handed parallel beta-helix repeat-containing protein [Prosthecobacter vanneervenii]MBB5034508.1 nitrous oxidase accessory protein NosD [Prosthecobacter vanneervenii]
MIRRLSFLLFLCATVVTAADLSVANYSSIQAALDANPNRMLFVPAGDYSITQKIRIRGDRSGLFGPGRIIQQSADQPIIEIENATGAEIRDLTLTRAEGKMDSRNEAILAIKCRDLVIENVRAIDNRSPAGAISVRESKDTRISRCLVRNYMRVSIDDRTQSKDWGYAFNCTDGTGISVSYSTGILIEGNRVIEDNFVPTPEVKARYKLGDYVKKNPEKGALMNQQAWDSNYTDAWQQGSGIIVTAPEISDLTRIIGNHIENAAQGLDIHADHVIVSQNIITNAFIGMKAMHGSRNVLITGNQFVRNSLWAIGLMPGAAAHPATDDKPENADGGSIISNNLISDFGYGDAHWIWGDERSPFKFDTGQQPDDPPLTDVVITGNVIHALGKPRYKYAVIIPGGPNAPRGLHFSSNLFHHGTQGICNTDLPQ